MPTIFPLLSAWDTRDTTITPSLKTYTYIKGMQYPSDVFNLVMPNVDSSYNTNYKDFKLHCWVPGLNYPGQNGATDVDLPSENIDYNSFTGIGFIPSPIIDNLPAYDFPSIDLVDNTYFPFVPEFKNLENLPIGLYSMAITFYITATIIANNQKDFIRYVNYGFYLDVQNDTSPTTLLTSPYANDLGFTLDAKEFIFSSANINTYLNIDITIKTYDFFSNLVNQYVFGQKMVLFKNKGTLELGSTVHRLMKNFDLDSQGLYQYQWASLQLDIQEKSNEDDTLIRQRITNEILFVAGINRGKSYGFLHFNSKPSRVTTLGYYILNIFIPDSLLHEVQVFKNGNLFDTIALPLCQNKIMRLKVSFEDFNKGDVLDYKLVETNNQIILDEKKVCVFPEGLNSYMIVWEDEFLLQSALECTGEAAIKLNIESTDQTVYKNLVEKTETLSVDEEYILSINSGWLMKSDVDAVISLIRSKRAWLITPDKKIELRRATKSIIAQKTDQELIEFDLEFKINKQTNAETYSL